MHRPRLLLEFLQQDDELAGTPRRLHLVGHHPRDTTPRDGGTDGRLRVAHRQSRSDRNCNFTAAPDELPAALRRDAVNADAVMVFELSRRGRVSVLCEIAGART